MKCLVATQGSLCREKLSSWPTLNVAKPRFRLWHLHGHSNSRLHPGCYCRPGEGRDSLSLPPCAPLFCATKRPNQILFFKLLKMAQALLFTHNKYTFSFHYSGSQEPKLKLEHWNSHGLNHQWDTSGADADVPSLDLFRAWTVLDPHAPELPSASFPVPASCSNQHCLQQMSHVGRSLNTMPKCNTGPDAIKKK